MGALLGAVCLVFGCGREPSSESRAAHGSAPINRDASVEQAIPHDAAPTFAVAFDDAEYPDVPPPAGDFRWRATPRDSARFKAIRSAVQSAAPRFAACWLKPDSIAVGLAWTIGITGEVLSARALPSITSPPDPARDQCVAEVVRAIAFPPGPITNAKVIVYIIQ